MRLDSDRLVEAFEKYPVMRNITLGDLMVLVLLAEHDKTLPSVAFAEWLSGGPNYGSRRTRRLRELGLLQRPPGRGAHQNELTRYGRALVQEIQAHD